MNVEEQVIQAAENFQSFVLVELVNDWIRSAPHPQALINELLRAWRARMSAVFDHHAKAIFERTGVLSTDRDALEQICVEAEKRIREGFTKMLQDSDEVDELARKHSAGGAEGRMN